MSTFKPYVEVTPERAYELGKRAAYGRRSRSSHNYARPEIVREWERGYDEVIQSMVNTFNECGCGSGRDWLKCCGYC